MDLEMKNHEVNGTWEVIERRDLPDGAKVLGGRWVYALKKDATGAVTSHKARCVAKGYNQRPGIDFIESTSPVMSVLTYRILCALIAVLKWNTKQVDCVAAYLNRDIDVPLFMNLPDGSSETRKRSLRFSSIRTPLEQKTRCIPQEHWFPGIMV